MDDYLLKVISVVLWSGLKFVFGFGLCVLYEFNWLETLIYTVGGGMLGVVFYLYIWEFTLKIWHRFFPRKPIKVKFSRYRRRLVVFIRKYEVWGIAILSPVLLSMLIGTILAISIEHNKWRIKILMFIALIFWASVLLMLQRFFGFNIAKYL